MTQIVSNEEAERRAAQAMRIPESMRAWAWAICRHEGGRPNDRNIRNNNPGNLKYFGQAGAQPEVPISERNPHPFAKFDNLSDGWVALYHQLRKYVHDHPRYTLLNWASLYLGGDPFIPIVTKEGDPFRYADAMIDRIAPALRMEPSAVQNLKLENMFSFVQQLQHGSEKLSSHQQPGGSVPGNRST